jgi:hypothetical protein
LANGFIVGKKIGQKQVFHLLFFRMDVLIVVADPSNKHRIGLAKDCAVKLSELSILSEIRATGDDHTPFSMSVEDNLSKIVITIASPGACR